jgi:hypothetical protein
VKEERIVTIEAKRLWAFVLCTMFAIGVILALIWSAIQNVNLGQ